MGQDHWYKSHGQLPKVQGLLLGRVLCCVILHWWTGAYQGRALREHLCHSCKRLSSHFGSAQQTASGIGTELPRTVHLDGATLISIWDCTLNLTLKWPVNLWAVFTWAFIERNCNLRDSTLGIQPGVNCHPHFYCVNYSKPWIKILEGDRFVNCWSDTGRHTF